MKSILLIALSLFLSSAVINAQDGKVILVKAGTRVTDYFPVHVRYLFPDFVPGQVFFRNGKESDMKLNYNILNGEMEFLQAGDTLSINSARKKEILYMVARDTFIYAGGFIQVLEGGELKVGLRQYVRIKDVLKKGAYGTTNRSSSIDSYNSMSAGGISYDLVPDEDIELVKELDYYISNRSGEFVPFSKKNVTQMFPDKSEEIKAYIKSRKVDFSTKEDLLKFADYLRTL